MGDIGGMVALGCFRSGGCYYLREGQDYPYDGFCTYKTYEVNTIFSTESNGPVVTRPPTPAPVRITPSPVQLPAPTPTGPRCGCESCTEEVWDTSADGYTCGERISFVRDSDVATLQNVGINNGPFDEAGACRFVSDEFPDICTCQCDDEDDTSAPTSSPTTSPTKSPTSTPTSSPTSSPTNAEIPDPAPVAPRCGCETCTEAVWDTTVDGYTCGARISFVRDSDVATLESVSIFTGPFDEEGACRFVSDEFPDVCTCSCDEDED